MGKGLVTTRRVQFSETDMAGVLQFANYYRIMEEVEHEFWRSLGASVMTRDGEREIGWPRVATSCEYFAPARFEDELEVALKVAHVGDRSVSYELEFHRDGLTLANGRVTAVCCVMGPKGFEAISIPPTLRSKLEGEGGAD